MSVIGATAVQNAQNVTGVVAPANGGSGVASPTGYAYGNGAANFTFSTTIPYANLSGAPSIPTSASWPNAGTCTSGQYVDALVNGTVPTCAVVQYSQLGGSVPIWNQNTTGTAANVTGVVAPANGGTGVASPTGYAYGNGASNYTFSTTIPYSSLTGTPAVPTSANWPNAGTCTAGQYVDALVNGTTPTCAVVQYSQLGGAVPTWNQNTTGTAANVTGVVGTANGGTSFSNPSGYIYFNGASVPATSGVLMHSLSFSDMSTTAYGASQVVARYISGIPETITASGSHTVLSASCASTFSLASPTTSGSTFSIQYNGTQFGTVAFSAGTSSSPTITITQQSVASGGVLSIVAPGTADTTAAGLYGSLCVTY